MIVGKLKTNVVKRDWCVPVVRKKDSKVMMLTINAESYSAAKLLVSEEYMFDEDSVAENRKVSEN